MANPNPDPPPSSSTILRRAAARAIDSLLRWARSHARKHQKPPSTSHIHLILTMNDSVNTSKRHLIPLPHPLHPITSTSICLIFDDRPNSPLTLSTVKDSIFSNSIPISKVVTFTSFKSDLKSRNARRDLFQSHDVFFIDSRVIQMLGKLIGERFLKKKRRQFLPIDLGVKSRWKEQIESKCGSATMSLRRTSACCDMSVAKVSMGRDEIVNNVVAVIKGAVEKVPGGWDNVRLIDVKTDVSIPLPVYRPTEGFGEDMENSGDDEVRGEKRKGKKRKNGVKVVGDSVDELKGAKKRKL